MKLYRVINVLSMAIALLPAKAAWAQQPGGRAGERKPDPALVERGSQVYRANCGFCHGVDARGAAGPDLARSLVVLQDVDGNKLGAFLKTGRPDAGMPAFMSLSPQQSADMVAFLHARIEESRARAPMDFNAIVVGNAAEGAAFFA